MAVSTGSGVGYVLSHEQFAPGELIEYAVAAEAAGFDAVWASDHFHPWQDNQGHAGHAWITLAAIGQRTGRVTMGTAVTCPIYRYNPAIVAQAFATLGLLYPGRVFLGAGTGEAVNEAPAGGGWGPYRERLARLREAITLIRRLWAGGGGALPGEAGRRGERGVRGPAAGAAAGLRRGVRPEVRRVRRRARRRLDHGRPHADRAAGDRGGVSLRRRGGRQAPRRDACPGRDVRGRRGRGRGAGRRAAVGGRAGDGETHIGGPTPGGG